MVFSFLHVVKRLFQLFDGRLYLIIHQVKRRVHLVHIHHHLWVVHSLGLCRFDQGIAGPYSVVKRHISPGHPSIGPRLRVGVIQRPYQVLEHLEGFFFFAFNQMSAGNHIVVVVNPLVQLRALQVFLLPTRRRHRVLIDYPCALLNGTLH